MDSTFIFIARRYLQSTKENRFFSWISMLSIFGIAIGIATMIVVLSVINGFEEELRNRFLAANAHILTYRFPNGMKAYENWEKDILGKFGKEIKGIAPFVHFDTMGRKDYLVHAMLVRGVVPKERASVQSVEGVVRPMSAMDQLQVEIDDIKNKKPLPEVPSIILGRGLLSIMNAKVGDVIELISPTEKMEDAFSNLKKFKIIGVYDSGLQHYDNKLAIVSLPAAQNLFAMGDLVTGLEIGLNDPDRSIEIAAQMRDEYNLSIKEWQSFNRNIFEAMKNERVVIALIVALVAFVGSFNILTTLFVSVSQKQRDISILKSLGASNSFILKVFLAQSFLMGLVGATLGVLLALVISYIIVHYPFIELPDIYLLAHLPVEYDVWVYLSVFLTGVAIATVAGFYPAWSATKVNPVAGIANMARRA